MSTGTDKNIKGTQKDFPFCTIVVAVWKVFIWVQFTTDQNMFYFGEQIEY